MTFAEFIGLFVCSYSVCFVLVKMPIVVDVSKMDHFIVKLVLRAMLLLIPQYEL